MYNTHTFLLSLTVSNGLSFTAFTLNYINHTSKYTASLPFLRLTFERTHKITNEWDDADVMKPFKDCPVEWAKSRTGQNKTQPERSTIKYYILGLCKADFITQRYTVDVK